MSDTPITKLSSLDISPDKSSKYNGFYLPQLTDAERDAIPAELLRNGALIYNSTTNRLNSYINGAWVSVTTGDLLEATSKTIIKNSETQDIGKQKR